MKYYSKIIEDLKKDIQNQINLFLGVLTDRKELHKIKILLEFNYQDDTTLEYLSHNPSDYTELKRDISRGVVDYYLTYGNENLFISDLSLEDKAYLLDHLQTLI